MRLIQLTAKPNYLYEGLDRSEISSIMLWESAGLKLKEAALTADQIQNLFREIETAATAAGGNRTMLGKGKDAASAVNKAWEDLKTKMQDSGPVKNFDQKVSDALSKIGMGADDPQFDGQVNKWVQKYRDFAKKHPIAQGAIYATLIALAGISGAGVGGAAALGLLKMADQLLQGKRFSSAAYSGVKTGVLAFGASKLGDYIKGLMKGDQIPAPGGAAGELPPELVPKMDFEKYDYYLGNSNEIVAVTKGAPNPFTGGGAGGIGNIDGADLVPKGESKSTTGHKLSEGQIYMVFNRISARNDQMLAEGLVFEGPLDAIKSAAGKGMDWMKTKGKNLTTKVTADKLTSAWKSAGSPMDSNAIADLLKAQGIADDVITSVYTQLKLPKPGAAPTAGTVDLETVKQMIAKLPVDRKARLLTYMLGGKKAMNKPSAEPEDNPNIVRGTESIVRQGKKI